VEKRQRHFIISIFHLPQNTPDYAKHFETGLPSLFAYTLGVHFKYVRKALEIPPHRYKNMANRSQNFQKWCSLANAHNMELSVQKWETQ